MVVMKRVIQEWRVMQRLLSRAGVAIAFAGLSECIGAEALIQRHHGMANASAGVSISTNLFAAASDEDNTLRVYRMDRDGAPVETFEVSAFLKVSRPSPEADLEGAARIGNRIYWLGSHARNKDGRWRPNRHRFFATELTMENGRAVLR